MRFRIPISVDSSGKSNQQIIDGLRSGIYRLVPPDYDYDNPSRYVVDSIGGVIATLTLGGMEAVATPSRLFS